MNKISTNEIRSKWLKFFEKNGHLIIEPKSLIPHNDKSLLWINSGVATLKSYFSGEKNPPCKRLVNSQKAIRTNDIENVGLTSRHHTFFEMLGNFSIGDYFKNEAIEFGLKILTEEFGFDLKRLYFTVFKDDIEAYNKWISLGINQDHIIKCDKNRNFWDVGSGPCGPCTEIYYDRGEKYDPNNIGINLFLNDIENDRYVEIWNIVFSQFNNNGKNDYTELLRKNIDTGAGLERLASIIQDVPTNFDIDIFIPIINEISTLSPFNYDINNFFNPNEQQTKINYYYRIIADHIKACVFAIADGAIPSNKERGYIIRRLIRRSMVYARKIKIDENFISKIALKVIEVMNEFYPYLNSQKNKIIECLNNEEKQFNKTLNIGYDIFNNSILSKSLNVDSMFKMVETYGFPIELIKELAEQNKIEIDLDGFNKKMKIHQEISKANNDVKAMAKQNNDLISFNLKSNFDYNKLEMNSKIIGIFDFSFNRISNIDHNEKYWLVFNQTILYANSGGQIADIGYIIINNIKYQVLDVIKGPNLQHLHLIETKSNEKINIDDDVFISIDYEKRKIISAHHSTEHLIHKALKELIDPNIKQEGAFKSHDKVTFDFNYHKKLTEEEILSIEDKINEWIKKSIIVEKYIKTFEEAKAMNALAYFEDVYSKIDSKLNVIKIGDISTEICGGTHVDNTKDIEEFRITKFLSNGSGSWRIEGISTKVNILNLIQKKYKIFKEKKDNITNILKQEDINDDNINKILNDIEFNYTFESIQKIEIQLNHIESIIFKLTQNIKIEKNLKETCLILEKIDKNIDNKLIIVNVFENFNHENLIKVYTQISNKYKEKCFVCFNQTENKTSYFIITNKNNKDYQANELIKKINLKTNGSGGGKNNFAQGGCAKLNNIMQLVNELF